MKNNENKAENDRKNEIQSKNNKAFGLTNGKI